MSAHIVSASTGGVEQPFASTDRDKLAAARHERTIRASERKRIQEIQGRHKQAFDELATLEEQHGRGHPDVRAARARAWAVARELGDARKHVDQRIQNDKRARSQRRRAS